MNSNGTHVGRPAYTPEQRMEASRRQFERGLTVVKGDHWHVTQAYFLVPGNRKVRKAKFAFMAAHPDHTFGPNDRIYVKCPDKACVNPKHMICVDATKKIHLKPNGEPKFEADFLADARNPEFPPTRHRRAVTQLKWYWTEYPIDKNHPDIELRWEFVPDPLPDDPDELRALLAEFGIISAS